MRIITSIIAWAIVTFGVLIVTQSVGAGVIAAGIGLLCVANMPIY